MNIENLRFEDALRELKDLAVESGFRPIAGAAFIRWAMREHIKGENDANNIYHHNHFIILYRYIR